MLTFALASALMFFTLTPSQGIRKIVMMGDSITEQGVQEGGYVDLVAKNLVGVEVIGVGISGQKVPDMLARFQKDVIDRKPDIVTLSVGVNDVWHDFMNPEWTKRVPKGNSGRGVALNTYIAGIEKMADMAQQAGIRMILLSPTVIYEDLGCAENKRLEGYIKAAEGLAKQRGLTYVHLYRSFSDAIKGYQKHAGKGHLLLTYDGVHMNAAGNALMAQQVLKALGKELPDVVKP